ncbi:MAG: tetratricopeptide repeat protein, partial [Rhodospirillales bacterium]|nr:tetratricopeptide repeat protein [Rhodospirillales bacterium]
MEAYDYMLRGRDLLQRFTPDDSREAIIMFEKSIALDPNFAAPLGECAITMFNQYFSGWDNAGPEIFEKGQQLLARAVKLDPEDSNAQRVLAIGRLWSRDLDGALAAADRSISLDPNNAAALAARGNILGYAGRHDEAIENLTDAIRLDPHHFPIWLYFLAHSHVLKGEFGTAAHLLQQRIRRDPDTDISRALLASCYGLLGRAEEAREMWDEMLNINPDYSLAQKARVLPYKNPADWDFIVDGLRKAGIVKEETEE